MKKNKKIILSVVIFAILLFVNFSLFARAGGGGGEDFGGGDGDILQTIIYFLMYIPFPYNVIIIGAIVLLFFIFRKKIKQLSMKSMLQAETKIDNSVDVVSNFKNIDKSFDEGAFIEKVKTAFLAIQDAWIQQDLKKVRKFISDGVYRRFSVQFLMMKKLQQKNILSDIKVHSINIKNIRNDGEFEVIDLAIHASMKDKFVSEKIKKLSENNYDSFIEYWTFIRKRGRVQNDIYNNPNCPQCGAALPEMDSETAICPYCKTLINNGDFDWILCEITQREFFDSRNNNFLNSLYDKDEAFSMQMLEDKASNAFLQYQISLALCEPAIARRFMRQSAFEDLETQIKKSENILYNRLFLSNMDLITYWNADSLDFLAFQTCKNYQRIQLNKNNKDEIDSVLDPVVVTKNEYIVLCRKDDAIMPKGLLYSHQCPNCAGTLSDTTNINCPYCGAETNSPAFEWVVDGVYSHSGFLNKSGFEQAGNGGGFGLDNIDNIEAVRDYAFNNILIMLTADGEIDTDETNFIRELVQKFNYDPEKIPHYLEMAKTKKLVLRMPEDVEMQEKVISLMEMAANANNNISQEEMQILEYVKNNFGSDNSFHS